MQKHIAHEEGYRYEPVDYQKHICISDIDVASTMVCKNHELVTIEKISDTKANFVFRNEADINKLIQDFWENKTTVYPLEFANARKNLKSRIYGMNKNY